MKKLGQKKNVLNKKSIGILNEIRRENEGISFDGNIVTDIGKRYVEGYNLYGGVFKLEAWEVVYILICMGRHFMSELGISEDEFKLMDVLMHNKLVEENEKKIKKYLTKKLA